MPSSGSRAPSLPPGALGSPHVSPSTSALSLVLSHGEWRKVSQGAPCWASPGAHQDPPPRGGAGSGAALPPPPKKGEAGHAHVGLGPSCTAEEAEAKASARLRATKTGRELAGPCSLFSYFCWF